MIVSFQATSPTTLAAFLMENEGKRCVVVLDVSFVSRRSSHPLPDIDPDSLQEIEKTEDEKYLSSLLMPWELGRYNLRFTTTESQFDRFLIRSLLLRGRPPTRRCLKSHLARDFQYRARLGL